MASRGAPSRKRFVAAERLNRCDDAGPTPRIPARSIARLTMELLMLPLNKGRSGARLRRNTFLSSLRGRTFQDVVPQCVTHILRQRQLRLSPRLPADPDDGPVPVDIVEMQPGDVADP